MGRPQVHFLSSPIRLRLPGPLYPLQNNKRHMESSSQMKLPITSPIFRRSMRSFTSSNTKGTDTSGECGIVDETSEIVVHEHLRGEQYHRSAGRPGKLPDVRGVTSSVVIDDRRVKPKFPECTSLNSLVSMYIEKHAVLPLPVACRARRSRPSNEAQTPSSW